MMNVEVERERLSVRGEGARGEPDTHHGMDEMAALVATAAAAAAGTEHGTAWHLTVGGIRRGMRFGGLGG